MTNSRVKLEYKCPVKWDSLEPTAKGMFCSQCQKEVRDYSSTGLEELNHLSATQFGNGHCGSFRAYQLERPFQNRKDRLILFYQHLKTTKTRFRVGKSMLLLVVFAALFLFGCTRRLSGRNTNDWFIKEGEESKCSE